MKTGKHLKYKGSCVLPHVLSVVWFIISRVGQCDASKCFKKWFFFVLFFLIKKRYYVTYSTIYLNIVHWQPRMYTIRVNSPKHIPKRRWVFLLSKFCSQWFNYNWEGYTHILLKRKSIFFFQDIKIQWHDQEQVHWVCISKNQTCNSSLNNMIIKTIGWVR